MNNKSNKKSRKQHNSINWNKSIKEVEDKKGRVSSGKCNDIAWYTKNPLLAKIAGLVNFVGSIVGKKVNIVSTWLTETISIYKFNRRIPGVIALSWLPTPGVSEDANSPINKCASEFFQILRLKNFSLSVYDACDAMFYLLAADSICAMFGYMTLIYAHARKWAFTNDYYPKGILEALHVDFQDIVDNLDAFLFYINKTQVAINEKLRIPRSWSYAARHMHMSAQVYKDNESEKAQLYVFVPAYLHEYDATTPQLKTVPVGANPTPLKFTDIKSIMDSMLNNVLPDEDFQIIAADIEKYFGGEMFNVNPIDWDTMADPVYNKEMLWQIHNCNMCEITNASSLAITQKVDGALNTIISFEPTLSSVQPGILTNRIIDSNSEAPDATEVIESTRLMFTVKDVVKSTTQVGDFSFKLSSVGSELLINCKMVQFDYEGNLRSYPITTFVNCQTISDPSSPSGYSITLPWNLDSNNNLVPGPDFRSLVDMAVFEYRPILIYGFLGGGLPNWDYMPGGVVAPLDNYAIIETQQLDAINEQCLLSQFKLQSNVR